MRRPAGTGAGSIKEYGHDRRTEERNLPDRGQDQRDKGREEYKNIHQPGDCPDPAHEEREILQNDDADQRPDSCELEQADQKDGNGDHENGSAGGIKMKAIRKWLLVLFIAALAGFIAWNMTKANEAYERSCRLIERADSLITRSEESIRRKPWQ